LWGVRGGDGVRNRMTAALGKRVGGETRAEDRATVPAGPDAGVDEIVVEGLSYAYPGACEDALSGVDLRFERGRYYSLLGRNGSGKSTLARCLNALLVPTRGTVTSCGLDTCEPLDIPDIRQRLAMVFQDPDTQIVGITVEDEVAFGPENLGLAPDVIRERVDSAMELAGIAHLAKRQPLRLSQGQKQLVAIAGALAMEPAFLISDESTSMLDHASRRRIVDLLTTLAGRGVGVIHVTHFLEEASTADEVVVLEAGRVAAVGAPAQVLADPSRAMELGLDPLPVTQVGKELAALGHRLPGGILTVEELLAWLRS
jgi:energy-coupling factor transport system ATP-binding protein